MNGKKFRKKMTKMAKNREKQETNWREKPVKIFLKKNKSKK